MAKEQKKNGNGQPSIQDQIKETFELEDDRGLVPDDETGELEPEEEPTKPVDDETPSSDDADEGNGEDEEEGEGDSEEEESAVLTRDMFEQMQNQLNELREQLQKGQDSPEPEEVEEEAFDAGQLGPLDVTDEELDEALDSPSKMLSLLQKVRAQAVEDALKLTPDLAARAVEQKQTARQAAQKFFEDNPDLEKVRNYIGLEANTLYERHPDWTLSKLFEEAGKEVRRKLGLHKKAKEIDEETSKKAKVVPKTAPTPGTSQRKTQPTRKLSPRQKEIAASMGLDT